MSNDFFDFDRNSDNNTTKGGGPNSFIGFDPISDPFPDPEPPKPKWPNILLICLLILALGGGVYAYFANRVSTVDIPDDASEHDDHHYKVYDASLSWSEAKDKCESKGGHLVTITNKSEQNFISSLIEKNGNQKHYWLGGTDENEEGEWEWVTGEDFDEYTNWEQGKYEQPNNNTANDSEHGEDYLEIQAVFAPDNPQEYMTWNDTCITGDAERNAEEPWYYSNKYFGYICEWDE